MNRFQLQGHATALGSLLAETTGLRSVCAGSIHPDYALLGMSVRVSRLASLVSVWLPENRLFVRFSND